MKQYNKAIIHIVQLFTIICNYSH